MDNHVSTTISNKSSHFIGSITTVKVIMVKGFGGLVEVKGEVTLVWKIEDDNVFIPTIKIKKSLYVPEAPSYLFTPQQWVQQSN